MLKKINRISRRKDFLEIKNKGKMFSTPLFGAVCFFNETDEIKFGFVISKKISKRAVDRNKIKRRMCEILKKRLGDFRLGTKIIFLAKKNLLEAKMEDVEKEINNLISNV